MKLRKDITLHPSMISILMGALSMCVSTAHSQAPTSSMQTPTRAQQVPLSGRQSTGSTTVQQSAVGGGGTETVNTINSTVELQGAYQGSVLDKSASGESMMLSLADAIRRAIQFNLGSVGASNASRQARAARLTALSSLLPNLSGSMSYTETKTDLEAIGLSKETVPGIGSALPKATPNFHFYDVRGTATQSIFDRTALGNYRSAKALESASQMSELDAREQVILAAGGQYLRVISADALVKSQEAQVQYAQASYNQAEAQSRVGAKSRVDTQRSLVELQTEQQRLSSNRADLEKQLLILLRVIGLPLRMKLSLVESLSFHDLPVPSTESALEAAIRERFDLKAAAEQVRAAERALTAARSQRIPSVTASGFYGIDGITPNVGVSVFGATATVSLPIWNGGRTHADIEQASASLAQRQAEYQDQEQVVELDIRNALIDLRVAADQVKLAESNRKLAVDTLKQSQDRFVEGVADSVEVVQSSETLAAAEHDYISSLYEHNLAKLRLARATGQLATKAAGILKEQP